ncbi:MULTISPECIES: hypothetical protein [Enterobacteriaceae]|uniref:Uncharacterized protein n=1 Tax=Enterobacter asburiae TaxID=61645 RepID=A0AAQ0EUX5_ENTAS|nr:MULTISPECIES: hypothetical protein [Enterobacteriaceae]HAS0789489.1 hypothetical protein [Enterobacter hormaechei subsp. xiangfangensis]HCU0694784.1 hypothetical protein [Enterobacter hormaechei]KVJ51958.1 hypothetical protein AWS31_14525 [Enterobacter hormaechei subsp. steigerwaltii]KVK26977.1 hypothetical protein AWS15_10645 [Enterobacter hormaechei subsp. steigerwaltii]MCU2329955.1 hypothetical protein [Enterobacter hormaechei subsp. steigerwaltii]
MKKDKKIFNVVMILVLLVAPVAGILFMDAPAGVEGNDATFFKAAIGLGFGLLAGAVFAIVWLVKRLFGK